LTKRGRELLATCAEITDYLEEEILDGVPASERKALRAALRHVAGNLGPTTD
jgi:DNA-binding MarR family transcriptional regulator